jgi:K+-transporting ATPase KdpF subunit
LAAAGPSPEYASGSRGGSMDYWIAGVTALLLFLYLLYALVRPERF